jgi:hypothetical protein
MWEWCESEVTALLQTLLHTRVASSQSGQPEGVGVGRGSGTRLRKYNGKHANETLQTANFSHINITFQLITAISDQFVFHRVKISPSMLQATT